MKSKVRAEKIIGDTFWSENTSVQTRMKEQTSVLAGVGWDMLVGSSASLGMFLVLVLQQAGPGAL